MRAIKNKTMCFEDSLSLSGFRFLSSIHSFPQENKTKQEKCQFEGARGKKKKKVHTGSVLFRIGSCRHITEQDGGSIRSGENVHKTKVAQVRKMGFKTLRTATPYYTSFRGESQRRASGPCASDNRMERPPSNGTRFFLNLTRTATHDVGLHRYDERHWDSSV